MKEYPSIGRVIRGGTPIFAFDKLDGSNLRAETNRKGVITKFGKRHGLLDDSNPILKRGIPLIEAQADRLAKITRDLRWEAATFYFEFWGTGSFAGNHVETEQQVVTLFDVDVYKHGLLEPKEFLKLFGDSEIPTPNLLYTGNANQSLIDSIQDGTCPGMTFEGGVCKGAYDKKAGMPLMFKVKNRAWVARLKEKCGDNTKLFESLV